MSFQLLYEYIDRCEMDSITETAYLGLLREIKSYLSSLDSMIGHRETDKHFYAKSMPDLHYPYHIYAEAFTARRIE